MNTIEILKNSRGRFVRISNVKLDGTPRSFNCKVFPGTFNRLEKGINQVVVMDVVTPRRVEFRSIVLDTVTEVVADRQTFKF
jgi:hypothetical protein